MRRRDVVRGGSAPGAERPSASLSVIIPTLDEADLIRDTLAHLQALRASGHEVIVVDGGSTDGTAAAAAPYADRVVDAKRGRARQMNAGAEAARGDILLFLHADTRLPDRADSRVLEGLRESGRDWGRFDVRLSGRHPLLRLGERWISARSRVTAVATGDQAIFVSRERFITCGGYPEIPLMEDVALTKRLRAMGRPLCIRTPVVTSSRRWEEQGILRTAALMCRLRLSYWLGTDPERLAEVYQRG